MKDCDIVVTNPPFSLFRELFSLLMKYNKKFLIIGNQNVLLYKEVFPYIMKDEVRLGYEFGEMYFRVPEGSDNEFDLFKPILNGKEVFKRILIRRRVITN